MPTFLPSFRSQCKYLDLLPWSRQKRRRNAQNGLDQPSAEVLEARQLLTGFDFDDQISEAFSIGQLSTTTYKKTGYITETTDVDIFAVDAVAGQELSVAVISQSSLTPRLRLFGPLGIGNHTAAQELGTGLDGQILKHNVTQSGRYYIGVSELSNEFYSIVSGGPDIVSPNATIGKYEVLLADTGDSTEAKLPDLTGSSLDVLDDSVGPGEDFDVDFTINNTGAGDSRGFRVKFYASTNSYISTLDRLLGTVNVPGIASGQSFTSTASFTLPSSFTDADGEFYVGMLIDEENDIQESDETNNDNQNRQTDFDRVTLAARSDLTGSLFTTNKSQLSPGQEIEVRFKVSNDGNATAGEFKVAFYASTNEIISSADTLLGTVTISRLAAEGTTGVLTTRLTLPQDFADTDKLFSLGMIVDLDDQVAETFEANNRNTGKGIDFETLTLIPQVAPERVTITGPGDTSGMNPVFEWNPVTGADSYELWVTNRTTRKLIIHEKSLLGTSYSPEFSLDNGQIRVWVRAHNAAGRGQWSKAWDFNLGTVVAPPAKSVVTGPSSAANSSPEFRWESLTGADRYELWVTNRSTGKLVIHERSLSTNSFTPSAALANGRHRVWVRAGNASGWGQWSSSWDFTIRSGVSLPDIPVLTSPVSSSASRLNVTWESVPAADKYEVWITSGSTGRRVLHDNNLTTTSFVSPNDMAAGRYRVWVRAANSAGWGKWSKSQTITISEATSSNPDPNGANNSIASAILLGKAGAAGLSVSGHELIGVSGDTSDYYKFTVEPGYESQFRMQLTSSQGSLGNLSFDLFLENETSIVSTRLSGVSNARTKIFTLPSTGDRLAAGTYFVKFSSAASADLNYDYDLTAMTNRAAVADPNGANNSLATATSLGQLSSRPLNTTVTDRLAAGDATDYFTFSTNNRYVVHFGFSLVIDVTVGNVENLQIEVIDGNQESVTTDVSRSGDSLTVRLPRTMNARTLGNRIYVKLSSLSGASAVDYSLKLSAVGG